jgi:hypothetical protein
MADTLFAPISYDLIQNTPESNVVIGKLAGGEIKMLRLFECEPLLFANMRDEVMAIVTAGGGEILGAGHPTFDYVSRWDPAWKPVPNTICQYSLLNSRHDLAFFQEDHHWFADRTLNPGLKYIPEFVNRYFHRSEPQNFRIQAIAGGGELGQHRERIVAIPKREQHYKLRFHLPVVTNPGVRFMMDGEAFTMEVGWVYLFNQSCLHGVTNAGDELRVHLVFDYYLNDYIVSELIRPALVAATP